MQITECHLVNVKELLRNNYVKKNIRASPDSVCFPLGNTVSPVSFIYFCLRDLSTYAHKLFLLTIPQSSAQYLIASFHSKNYSRNSGTFLCFD